MGRFTDESESKGFIKELFQNLQSNLNAEQVKNFANLDNDEARYKFVSQNASLKEFTVSRNESIKNLKLSLDFKQKGNGAFQSQNWKSALDFYNKGLLLIPAEHGEYSKFHLTEIFGSIYRDFLLFFSHKSQRIFDSIGKSIGGTLSHGTL